MTGKETQRLKFKMLRIVDRELYLGAKADAIRREMPLWQWLEDAIREKLEKDGPEPIG